MRISVRVAKGVTLAAFGLVVGREAYVRSIRGGEVARNGAVMTVALPRIFWIQMSLFFLVHDTTKALSMALYRLVSFGGG